MVVIVIHHSSTLAAYLVALATSVYLRHSRHIRLVVVESSSTNFPNRDLKPWCGTSTVSNLHLRHHDFLVTKILARVLIGAPKSSVVALASVSLAAQAPSGYVAMDRPVHSQRVQVRVSSGKEHMVGLVYHPVVVMNYMRSLLVASVTFVSPRPPHALQQVVAQIAGSEAVVVLDFVGSVPAHSTPSLDLVINSNLVDVVQTGGLGSVPRSLLWLPRLGLHPSARELYQPRSSSYGSTNVMSFVFFQGQDRLGTEIASQLDLNYCMQACDAALGVLDGLIEQGAIQIFSKL